MPTEAEWEYAARCGTDLLYAGSNVIDDVAWYESNSGEQAHVVGGLASNACGLYDMSGNVWEWVNDWYDSGYYSSSPAEDPAGPTAVTSYRVVRGGSWNYSSALTRIAYRSGAPPSVQYNYIGFRLSRSIP